MSRRGAHSGVADPRRVPKRLAEWAGFVVAVAIALWMFFGALDPTTAALARRWGDDPLLLMTVGWLPVGGLLCAGAGVALRHESLRRRDRRMTWLEEHFYGFIGLAWFGFAMLMAGTQGRYEPSRPTAVVDHVASTSEAIALGVAAGDAAPLFTVALAVAFGLRRFVIRRPGPRWPVAWTVASWLLGGAALSLTALLAWGATAT